MSLTDWVLDILGRDEDVGDPVLGTVRTQNRILTASAESSGEVGADTTEGFPAIHDHIAAPDGGAIGLPSGVASFDFDGGELHHSTQRDPVVDIRSLSDIDGADNLRSAAVACDVPAEVEVDNGDRFEVRPGDTVRLSSTQFRSIRVTTGVPARMAVLASTRADPLSDDLAAHMQRVGVLPGGTYDTFEQVGLTTPETAKREDDYQAHTHPLLPLAGRGATFVVENTSAASNNIDVEVRGRVDSGEDMMTLATADAVSQGDHVVINLNSDVYEVDVRVRNSTDTEQVAARVQVHGGA